MVLSQIYEKKVFGGDEGDGVRHYDELISKRLFISEEDAKNFFAEMQQRRTDVTLFQTIVPATWPKNIGPDGYDVHGQMPFWM